MRNNPDVRSQAMTRAERFPERDVSEAVKPTAIETVHQTLRARIMNGTLAPGDRLHVDNLRLEFGVSTSTMREALSRLLIDSLVVSEQQRGFRVSQLSLKDFRDIANARKIVEAQALRASLTHRTEEWEANLVAAYHRLGLVEAKLFGEGRLDQMDAWDERNAHFHDCLVKNCDNAWLIRFRHTLHQQSHRYHRIALANERSLRDVRSEHRAIFETALAGEVDRCAALIEEHIDATMRAIIPRLPFE